MSFIPRRFFNVSSRFLAKKNVNVVNKPNYLGRVTNSISLGVVGLANVGKSTFFQAITKSTLGNPANYPFATIEPEKSQVITVSPKLDTLAELYQSQKKIPSTLTIYDIAGLTRNAASGEGLGNKFLSDIRQVDGIFQVVRGFDDEEIIHIEHKVDPVRDLIVVSDELILKDMDFVETGIEKVEKNLKKPHANKAQAQLELDTLLKAQDLLYDGRKIVTGDWSGDEIEILNTYNFLTAKPTVFMLNVSPEDYASQTNKYEADVRAWIKETSPEDQFMLFSAKYETELNSLAENPEELKEYIRKYNNKESAMKTAVDNMRDALHLISFYTCGPKEARQWTVREGSTAPEAAGCIHTTLQETFINAQVYKYADLKGLTPPINDTTLRSSGKQIRGGKNYIVEDGDVLLIKAADGKTR